MRWVLIDLSYLAHRARFALADLEFEDIPTGVMYGFFEQLLAICKNPPVCSNKILIFTDSKKCYRTRAFPGYKKRRKEQRTEEEQEQINIMYKQVNKLQDKILPKLGFPVFNQVGLESDDLIAYAAKKFTRKEKKAIIITSDFDLFQCITPYVKWYDPGRVITDGQGRGLLMDQTSFEIKYGLEPWLWGKVKALGGCTSDCVPGLKGIGEKTAIQYLKGEDISDNREKIINQGTKEIKKWMKLTVLPHKKTKPFKIHPPKYDSKSFFSFCKKYNIMKYFETAKRAQWVKFFKGNFKGKLKRRKRK